MPWLSDWSQTWCTRTTDTYTTNSPWQDVAIDLLGPLQANNCILLVIDYYSLLWVWYTEIYYHRKSNSLESIFSRHGLPITCRSDRGPQFQSQMIIVNIMESNMWKLHQHGLRSMERLSARTHHWWRGFGLHSQMHWIGNVNWGTMCLDYRSINHTTRGKSPALLLFGGAKSLNWTIAHGNMHNTKLGYLHRRI